MKTITLPHIPAPPVTWAWLKRVGYFLQYTGIFIPLIFLLFLFVQDPFSDAGDFDYDEGINVMKALLYNRHYNLYTDIWSDQPPLFTVLLSAWFSIFGESVAAARILVALFSALLLWSFYLVLYNSVSLFAAVGAITLLVLSQFYIRLSGSVMIGLPALALAMASLALLVRGKQRWWTFILSACVMALALQTKLFVAGLFPAIGLYLLLTNPIEAIHRTFRQRLFRFGFWLLIVTLVLLALSFYFRALNTDMLFKTHFGAQTRERLLFIQDSQKFIADFFQQQPIYLMLALVGLLYAIRQRHQTFIIPFMWFVIIVVAFIFHRPLWYHHILLLTIPMTWLCALSLEAWWRKLRSLANYTTRARLLQHALLAITAFALLTGILHYPSLLGDRLDKESKLYRPLYIWELVHQLQADAQVAPGFVFTDRPFYAFQADQLVTPPLAAISRKRLEAGALTDADLLSALTTYKPRYVILQRFTDLYSEAVMAEINQHYALVLEIPPGRYYRRLPDNN